MNLVGVDKDEYLVLLINTDERDSFGILGPYPRTVADAMTVAINREIEKGTLFSDSDYATMERFSGAPTSLNEVREIFS